MNIAITTALTNLIIALITPIKQSKKKLKYKKTLKALKLSIASILESRFRNISRDAIIFIIVLITIPTTIPVIGQNYSTLSVFIP